MLHPLKLFAAAALAAGVALPATRPGQDRPDGFLDRPDDGDRHPAEEHRRPAAAQDRQRDRRILPARRRRRHDACRAEREEADPGEQHRRADRSVDDAERAGHPRHHRGSEGADDGDGRHVVGRRAARREAPLGLQDHAERRPDRRCADQAHAEGRREECRLHRLQRSVRRELAQGVRRTRRQGRLEACRDRALQPHRPERDRAGAES